MGVGSWCDLFPFYDNLLTSRCSCFSESEKQYCYSLQLQGLGESAQELIAIKKLQDEDKYSELIDRYNGNPLWLNIIAAMIEDLFNSSIAQFLSYPTLFLGDLEPILHEHYQRLKSNMIF